MKKTTTPNQNIRVSFASRWNWRTQTAQIEDSSLLVRALGKWLHFSRGGGREMNASTALSHSWPQKQLYFLNPALCSKLLSSPSAAAQGTPRTQTNTQQHEAAEPSPRAPVALGARGQRRSQLGSVGTAARHTGWPGGCPSSRGSGILPAGAPRHTRSPRRGSVPISHRCRRAVLPAPPLPPARRGRAAASGPGQRRPHSGSERAGGCARTADTAWGREGRREGSGARGRSVLRGARRFRRPGPASWRWWSPRRPDGSAPSGTQNYRIKPFCNCVGRGL